MSTHRYARHSAWPHPGGLSGPRGWSKGSCPGGSSNSKEEPNTSFSVFDTTDDTSKAVYLNGGLGKVFDRPTLACMSTMATNDRTVRRANEAVHAAKAHWGNGWMHLSDEQKKGAIALQVVSILLIQDEETASPAMLRLQELANIALDSVDPPAPKGKVR